MDFSETIVVYDLKLATDDEVTEVSVDIKTLSPGCCMPPRGYIHVLKQEQNCIKSDFKEIF